MKELGSAKRASVAHPNDRASASITLTICTSGDS